MIEEELFHCRGRAQSRNCDTACLVYGENYTCLPMRHCMEQARLNKTAEYQWQVGERWCRLSLRRRPSTRPQEGSLNSSSPNILGLFDSTKPWLLRISRLACPLASVGDTKAAFEGEASVLYGRDLSAILQRRPDCAFVADGSPVIVFTVIEFNEVGRP